MHRFFLLIIFTAAFLFDLWAAYNGRELILWDDWVLFGQDYSTRLSLWDMLGHGIKGTFFELLYNEQKVWYFRLFVYFAKGIIALIIFIIVSDLFGRKYAFIISFIYYFYPQTWIETPISIAPFYFPLLIFFISAYLRFKVSNKSFLIVQLSRILFLFSFFTGSLLVFYFIFLALFLYKCVLVENLRAPREIIFRYSIDIILPFIFYLFSYFNLKPHGIYSGYNALDISVLYIFQGFFKSILEFVYFPFISGSSFVLFMVTILCFCSFLYKRLIYPFDKRNLQFLIIFFMMFFLSVFPYLAVNKQPVTEGWNSRFGLLVPISIGVFYSYLYSVINKERISNIFLHFLFALIVLFMSIKSYFISRDLVKHSHILDIAITSLLKDEMLYSSDSVRILLYVDNNLDGTQYNFYEWTGLYRFITKKADKLLVSGVMNDDSLIGYKDISGHKQYNIYDWNQESFANFEYTVKISIYCDGKEYFKYRVSCHVE